MLIGLTDKSFAWDFSLIDQARKEHPFYSAMDNYSFHLDYYSDYSREDWNPFAADIKRYNTFINTQLKGLRKYGDFLYDYDKAFEQAFSYDSAFEIKFPVVFNISATGDRYDIVSILVTAPNKYEYFESFDGTSDQTYALLNKILKQGKVTIYGCHKESLVLKIKQTGRLPSNLFVSPDKNYAESNWESGRVLFRGEIQVDGIRRNTEVDWVTKSNCPITNIVILTYF